MTDTITDKLILQAIDINSKKISEYEEQVSNIQEQASILYKEIQEYRAEYRKACRHNEGFKHESSYTEGGYDYVSETKRITKCSRCGLILETSIERGGYA